MKLTAAAFCVSFRNGKTKTTSFSSSGFFTANKPFCNFLRIKIKRNTRCVSNANFTKLITALNGMNEDSCLWAGIF